MIIIGDFSKLSRVPVKTLRYYDQIELLKPALVDKFSGYRFYTVDQMPRLNRILALKDLNFTMDQITGMLDDSLTPEQMRGMLRLKQAEIERDMDEEQARLRRIESRLRQIEQENQMPQYEVLIKKVDPIKVAAIRDALPNYASIGQLINEVLGKLGKLGIAPAGPPIAIYHDKEFKESDVDVETSVPISSVELPQHERIDIHIEVPRVEHEKLSDDRLGEPPTDVQTRVETARQSLSGLLIMKAHRTQILQKLRTRVQRTQLPATLICDPPKCASTASWTTPGGL